MKITGETLCGHLAARMEKHGSKVAQMDFLTGETVTFAEMLDGAEFLAAELRSRGLRPGHVAMIIGENSVHYTWVLLGVMLTGATPHLVNPRSTQRELRHAVSLSRPLLVLASCGLAALAEEPCLPHVLLWGGSGLGGLEDTENRDSEARVLRAPVQEQLLPSSPGAGDGVAVVLCSSGTTGLPKGVMLTHTNLLASLRAGSLGEQLTLGSGDVMLGILPYYHVYGTIMNLTAMRLGIPVVAVPKFPGTASLLSGIRMHGCTVMVVVPSLLASMAEHPDFTAESLPALRSIETGGTPLSPALLQKVRRRLPGARLIQAYGLTEACVTLLHTEARDDGTTGLPVADFQYKIVHPVTGEVVPRGERGELCVRTPTVMKGYMYNPEATAEMLDEQGWLHTGDIAYVDSNGYYFIVERLKFIFKYNGHQVSPTELEMLLCQHPGVREAAVLGVPHRYGEAPLALVVRREGNNVSPEKLQEFIEDLVEPHKRLRGGVRFVESLPKNHSGKLQRDQLPPLVRSVS